VLKTIRKERSTLHWWLHRRSRIPESSSGPFVFCAAVGIRAPGAICVHARKLVGALHLLRRIEAVILAGSWPPHHALWLCIHGHEAADWQNQDTGHNGHYGGLQLHPGWGYGSSYYASNDSQWTQEWAAERGYRASGFSRAWLMGQWAHYDCLGYA